MQVLGAMLVDTTTPMGQLLTSQPSSQRRATSRDALGQSESGSTLLDLARGDLREGYPLELSREEPSKVLTPPWSSWRKFRGVPPRRKDELKRNARSHPERAPLERFAWQAHQVDSILAELEKMVVDAGCFRTTATWPGESSIRGAPCALVITAASDQQTVNGTRLLHGSPGRRHWAQRGKSPSG